MVSYGSRYSNWVKGGIYSSSAHSIEFTQERVLIGCTYLVWDLLVFDGFDGKCQLFHSAQQVRATPSELDR